MKLDSPTNMGQVAGVCCRQAPLRGLLCALILCACFFGAAVLVWQQKFPWFVWGWCAAWAALIAPQIIADALAKFRSTNWLVWLGPDGLWINLRPLQPRPAAGVATAKLGRLSWALELYGNRPPLRHPAPTICVICAICVQL